MEKKSFLEGSVMGFLNKFVKLVALNLLTIICSIPVLTIGISATSLHYAVRKLHQGDERIFRMFFHSFKQNFWQATLFWIILLIAGCGIYFNFSLLDDTASIFSRVISVIAPVVWVVIASWLFPLLSLYTMKTRDVLRNVAIFAISYWPFTIVMLIVNLLPLIFFMVTPDLFIRYGYIWLFIWISLSALCIELVLIRIINSPKMAQHHVDADAEQDTQE